MKQRLGVAQALIHGPRLLLLDEPTSALDPIGRRDVLDMVASMRGRTTVFFSTHILADVERVCDTVAVIARGKRRRAVRHRRAAQPQGRAEPPQHRGRRPASASGRDSPAPRGCARWRRARAASSSSPATTSEAAQRELPALVGRLGLALRRFGVDELDLEDVFVDLVGEDRR